MPLLASDVMDDSAGLLVDVAKVLYTYTAQLPYLKQAHEDLVNKLRRNGIPVLDEQSGMFSVAAGAVVLATPPADMLDPLFLEERAVGENDGDWVPMERKDWEPSQMPDDTLHYWVWREMEIKFLGSTAIRQVRVKYRKFLTAPTTSGSNITVYTARSYLGKKTAFYCAKFIGRNDGLAADLNGLAEEALDDLLASAVNLEQDKPVRPRPFNWRTNA
jgi:hypothetical protein